MPLTGLLAILLAWPGSLNAASSLSIRPAVEPQAAALRSFLLSDGLGSFLSGNLSLRGISQQDAARLQLMRAHAQNGSVDQQTVGALRLPASFFAALPAAAQANPESVSYQLLAQKLAQAHEHGANRLESALLGEVSRLLEAVAQPDSNEEDIAAAQGWDGFKFFGAGVEKTLEPVEKVRVAARQSMSHARWMAKELLAGLRADAGEVASVPAVSPAKEQTPEPLTMFEPDQILAWLDKNPRVPFFLAIKDNKAERAELKSRLSSLEFLPAFAQEKVSLLYQQGRLDSQRIVTIYVWGSYPWGSRAKTPRDLDVFVVTDGEKLRTSGHYPDVPEEFRRQARAPSREIYLRIVPEKLILEDHHQSAIDPDPTLFSNKDSQGVWIAGERDVFASVTPEPWLRLLHARGLYDGADRPKQMGQNAKDYFPPWPYIPPEERDLHGLETVWARFIHTNLVLKELLRQLGIRSPRQFMDALSRAYPAFFMGAPLNMAMEALMHGSLATAESIQFARYAFDRRQGAKPLGDFGNQVQLHPASALEARKGAEDWVHLLGTLRPRIDAAVKTAAAAHELEFPALKKKLLLNLPRFSQEDLASPGTLEQEAERVAARMAQETRDFDSWYRFPASGKLRPELVSFRPVGDDVARVLYDRFHYLSSYRFGLHFGLFLQGRQYDPQVPASILTLSTNDVLFLRGLLPVGFHAFHSLVLSRMFAFDWAPKNSTSFLMGKLNEWLRKELPEIALLLTYVNPNVGFSGSSYLASNWLPRAAQMPNYTYVDGDYQTTRQVWRLGGPEGTKPRQALRELEIFTYTLHPEAKVPVFAR